MFYFHYIRPGAKVITKEGSIGVVKAIDKNLPKSYTVEVGENGGELWYRPEEIKPYSNATLLIDRPCGYADLPKGTRGYAVDHVDHLQPDRRLVIVYPEDMPPTSFVILDRALVKMDIRVKFVIDDCGVMAQFVQPEAQFNRYWLICHISGNLVSGIYRVDRIDSVTRRATPEEYAALKARLEKAGFNLDLR